MLNDAIEKKLDRIICILEANMETPESLHAKAELNREIIRAMREELQWESSPKD
jgi:hypothetical protein